MNVLNLRGPDFLVYFFVTGAASMLWLFLLQRFGNSPRGGLTDKMVKDLNPYEMAYLAGGASNAINAALVALMHRGQVKLNNGVFSLKKGLRRRFRVEPEGVFRGQPHESAEDVFLNRTLGILAALDTDRSYKRVHHEMLDEVEPMAERLKARGLWLSSTGYRWFLLLCAMPGLVMLGVGLTKMGLGIVRDQPIGWLLILWVTLFYVGLKLLRCTPHRTGRGDEALYKLRIRWAAIEDTAASAPQMVEAEQMAMAFALFGSSALSGMLFSHE
ncbi:MAG: TIGR04222 domain-containing membrane protein, partial [Myxococcota bacterium]